MTRTPSKPLLLLDFNGTLVHRTKRRLRGTSPAKINKHYLYPRPGLMDFLQNLSPLFSICLYSSAQFRTIEPILTELNINQHIQRVYDRRYNVRDVEEGEKPWDTKRDLNKIFDDTPEHDLSSVILVDNELRKMADFSDNGILISDYGDQEVFDKSPAALVQLTEYLTGLGEAWGNQSINDVRQFLLSKPFVENIARPKITQEVPSVVLPKRNSFGPRRKFNRNRADKKRANVSR
ncbi:hypothetical protein P9112_006677 [Eukaryota sp. TZLM1-RC]